MSILLDTNVLIRDVNKDDVLLRSLSLFQVERFDFADAYLVALAESTGVGPIASFDRSVDRIETVTRLEP